MEYQPEEIWLNEREPQSNKEDMQATINKFKNVKDASWQLLKEGG